MSTGTARVRLLTADQRRAEFPSWENHSGQTGPLVSLELGVQQVHNVYIEGVEPSETLLSKATHNMYICQNKEQQQYITVGTVRMFIEPSAKH